VSLTIVDHPLMRDAVTRLRDVETGSQDYRDCCRRVATILALRATENVSVAEVTVETPLESCAGWKIATRVVAIPVIRAGIAMLDGVLELFPESDVGFVGLQRDEATAIAQSYFTKLPPLADSLCLLLDPMLATGGSAGFAIESIKAAGGQRIALLSVVAAPEGVRRIERDHPDVGVFCAALDRELNGRKFILPGLGDFGDRLYGTGSE
jgi:uracil phosphoribosyltransferase